MKLSTEKPPSFVSYLKIHLLLFAIFGKTFNVNQLNFKKKWQSWLFKYYFLSCVVQLPLPMISMIIYISQSTTKMEEKLKNVPFILLNFEIILKLSAYLVTSDQMNRVLDDLQELHDRERARPSDIKGLTKNIRINSLYIKFLFSTAYLYFVSPIIGSFFTYINGNGWPKNFPAAGYYPGFDPRDYYLYVYFMFFFGFSNYTIWNNASESTMLILLTLINQQFVEISEDFYFAISKNQTGLKEIVDRQSKLYK